MPKLSRGKIVDPKLRHAKDLIRLAKRFENRADWSKEGDGGDDPRWLRRWAKKLTCLAQQKERSRKHKSAIRKKEAITKRRKSAGMRQSKIA